MYSFVKGIAVGIIRSLLVDYDPRNAVPILWPAQEAVTSTSKDTSKDGWICASKDLFIQKRVFVNLHNASLARPAWQKRWR